MTEGTERQIKLTDNPIVDVIGVANIYGTRISVGLDEDKHVVDVRVTVAEEKGA